MKTIHKARGILISLSLVVSLCFAGSVHATTYSQIVAFGDSLSDSGNIWDLFGGIAGPNPPYAEERFTSNFSDGSAGLVWVEHLATLMGLALDNSRDGGTNYAHGGATATDNVLELIPSLLDQTNTYLDDISNVADPNALYVVFGGGNDVRDNDIALAVVGIADSIGALAAAGATTFFVPNLPDIGLTPESLAGEAPGGSSAVISEAAAAFNQELATTLVDLQNNLGVDIITFDLFSIFNGIVSDPVAWGFDNVTDACFDGTNLCDDTDSYLFFDGIHPTAIMHMMMGQLAFEEIKAVPVPATLPLLLSALGFLGLARRNNRKLH